MCRKVATLQEVGLDLGLIGVLDDEFNEFLTLRDGAVLGEAKGIDDVPEPSENPVR